MVTDRKWREIEDHRTQVGDAQFAQMVKKLIPSSKARAGQVRLVIIRSTRATIVFVESGSKSAFSLVQQQGKWKVD